MRFLRVGFGQAGRSVKGFFIDESVWWLGTLMEALDHSDCARQCFERALQIFSKFLGGDHLTTLRNFLASLKEKKG